MAELNYKVDETDAEERSFDPVPQGEYKAIIEESDFVPTKSGKGMILKLKYQIVEGPFKDRIIFNNLNLINPDSPQAEQIAKRTLNAIGVAVGVDEIKDSCVLHNKPIMIDVRIKEDKEFGKKNSIQKHSPYNTQNVTVENTQPEETPQPKKNKQPWEK